MRRFFISTLISLAALSAVGLASAAGPAGGSLHGMGATNTNSNGFKATDRDFGKDRAGDRAGVKTKNKAALNSNGVKSLDRDKGKDRAADRRHRARHKSPGK